MDEQLPRRFLDRLEKLESRLLAWGVVDGGFSADELEALAEQFLAESDASLSPQELLDQLDDRRVLFRINLGGRHVYRTRMAETVRLVARLRQWFPGQPWLSTPTLVADYRFLLRSRSYPKRSVSSSTTVAAVEKITGAASTAVAGVRALLAGRAGEQPIHLRSFQFQSLTRVLGALQRGDGSAGTIVATGTGTGKTMAFYLPALSYLAGLIRANEWWTKAVAIYPRNELLKDQLAEAFDQARKLDIVLKQGGGRKLTIGTFFGLTPFKADDTDSALTENWDRTAQGFICPFLGCPTPGCDGDLVWTHPDVRAGAERLHCTKPGCQRIVGEDELILTRATARKRPPDLLFTTTETLNRQLNDSNNAHVFGVGPKCDRPPKVVLLDEVHTYTGVPGAQVGLLLRRWRHAMRWDAAMHWVGLSANRAGAYTSIQPAWPRVQIRLSGVLEALADRGATIRVATRPVPINDGFVHRLERAAHSNIRIARNEALHEKGLLGDTFYLGGSMNFTGNGITVAEEAVVLHLSPEVVAESRVTLSERWGGQVHG